MVTAASHYGDFLEPRTMILIIVLLIKAASCHEISKSLGERVNYNITKLYPVKNITYHVKENDNVVSEQKLHQDNKILEKNINNKVEQKKLSYDTTSSKHSSEYSNEESEEIKNNLESKLVDKGIKSVSRNHKVNKTTWTINAAYESSKHKENEDVKSKTFNDSKITFKNESKAKEFKPSPHLGNFYDEDTFITPPHSMEESFIPFDEPSSGIISFPKDFIPLQYKKPLDVYPPHLHPQYNFENHMPSKEYFQTGLEPRPTVEAPVRVPAGGLYQRPDVFKEKPGTDGDDANFGLEFNNEKDVAIKQRRVNPWKSVLNLVTSLIPVGIIISALTPSIITLENVNNNPHFPSRLSRRSDEDSAADLPPISEGCKRRLLCELHSDANYIGDNSTPHRPKHCYKILCDDTHALSKVLRWLLSQNARRRFRPNVQDRRGRLT